MAVSHDLCCDLFLSVSLGTRMDMLGVPLLGCDICRNLKVRLDFSPQGREDPRSCSHSSSVNDKGSWQVTFTPLYRSRLALSFPQFLGRAPACRVGSLRLQILRKADPDGIQTRKPPGGGVQQPRWEAASSRHRLSP